MNKPMKLYSPKEERLNVISHAFGTVLAIVGLIVLVIKGAQTSDLTKLISYSVFGLSLVCLYAASTFYHNEKDLKKRFKLKILDHCAIFILIAGSYTPYAVIGIGGDKGILYCLVAWGFALVGIILKFFFTGRFTILSTSMYLLLGYGIGFFSKSYVYLLTDDVRFYLYLGGFFYTVGAVIYSIKKIPFNHAIFHLFALAGSASQFISVYSYLN
jgi:hemolysin III